MDIDPTGSDERPVGIDLTAPGSADSAHFGDAPVGDGDVCGAELFPGAVGDHPAANH
jgi:hypothetical protein